MIRVETTATAAAGQLRAFVERIERVEEEIKELNGDKSDIYKELRGVGFDVKAVRQVIAKRKLDDADRQEQDAIFDMYWAALEGDASRVHVHEAEKPAPKRSAPKLAEVPAEPKPEPVQPDMLAPVSRPRPEMRPHCQNKAACAGVGHKHCYPCEKAAGLVEAAA